MEERDQRRPARDARIPRFHLRPATFLGLAAYRTVPKMPKSSKKGSLLSALKAHQVKTDIAARKKAQEAVYAPNRASGSNDRKRKRATATASSAAVITPTASTSVAKKGTRKPTIPFYPSRQILLVGEGMSLSPIHRIAHEFKQPS